jgi:predicted nucleic acid-binding protein
MLFDSEFVIAMSRRPGGAQRTRAETFLSQGRPTAFYISRATTAEVAAGCETRAEADALLRSYTVIEINDDVSWQASRLARELKGYGLHIGDNDIWIAATALVYELPLVSNNKRHLSRVPGLELRSY